ncbi:dynamin-like isoform X10, partial [Leptotrombidium deliense]
VPLKRGYIGVVNRSQSDITTNKDIKAAIEAEAQFFETHPAYKDIAHRLGTPYLQRSLNEQLIKHIKKSMPGLMQKLDTTVREVEVQQEKFALSFGNENSKRKIIFNALQEINNEFDMKVGLVLKSSKAPLEKDKLTGGALINRLMNEKYRSAIQKMSLNNEQMRREISLAITNIRGVHLGLFTPDMAFEAIVISELGACAFAMLIYI